MDIDRTRVLPELEGMWIDLSQAHLRILFDSLQETYGLYGPLQPLRDPDTYLLRMMAFASRLPTRELRPGAKVLDVKCGQGHLLMAIRRGFGIEAHGVDRFAYDSSHASAQAVQALWSAHNRSGVRVLSPFNASVTAMPYADGYFDAVISRGVTEPSMGAMKAGLADVFRVLKPGGTLVVDAPNPAFRGRLLRSLADDKTRESLPDYYEHRDERTEQGAFAFQSSDVSLDELVLMLQWAGFEIEAAEIDSYSAEIDDRGVLIEYLQAIEAALSADYGAHVSFPTPEQLGEVDRKIRRHREMLIVRARKPAA